MSLIISFLKINKIAKNEAKFEMIKKLVSIFPILKIFINKLKWPLLETGRGSVIP